MHISLLPVTTLCAGLALASNAAGQRLNELYLSHVGLDDQEFIELRVAPGASLAGMLILVVDGDGPEVGILDLAIDLSGHVGPADGYFVAGNTAVAELDLDLGPSRVFKNGTQTVYLVRTADVAAVRARVGTDVDPDGDGTTEISSLATILDRVALVDQHLAGSEDRVYDGSPALGPDGSRLPSGILRSGDAPGPWCPLFLDHDDELNADLPRTPGRPNVDGRSKLRPRKLDSA